MFAGLVLTAMVIGIVTLNVLLAQSSFRVGELEARLDDLSEEQLTLQMEEAQLSAPGTIATWARHEGMLLPDPGQVHTLRVGRAHDDASASPEGKAEESR